VYCSLIIFMFSLSVSGATRYVNVNNPSPAAPYETWATAATVIQDALDVSSDGDLVLVTNGVYTSGGSSISGNVLFTRVCVTNAVTVRSVNGPAYTIIVGAPDSLTGNAGSNAVRCALLIPGAQLEGFSITGGWTWATGNAARERAGAGFFLEQGGTVSNCVIVHNTADGNGGGGYINMGGSVYACQVSSNRADKGGGMFMRNGLVTGSGINRNNSATTGGGIHGRNSAVVEYCTFFYNRTVDDGGGILCTENATARYCTFDRNRAHGTYGTGGGVILYYGGSMDHCIIVSNFARYTGGGVAIYAGRGTMNNCLVYRNICQSYGGGMYCYAGGGAVANCTITENLSYYYYGGVNCNYTGIFYNTIIYYNTAWSGADEIGGNNGVAYNCCIPTNGGLNVIVDCFTNAPQFVNRATDNFRLLSASPCIDSGNDNLAAGTLDLDNVGRIMGAHVDRGAYEYHFLAPALVPPSVIAPVVIPPGLSDTISLTNTTSIHISGFKSSGILAAAPWTTNDISQTLAGTSWEQSVQNLPCEVDGAASTFSYRAVSNDLYTVSASETTLHIVNYRMLPYVAITSIPTWVPYDITLYDIAGTNNPYVAGTMLWTNRLNNTHGTVPAQAAWSVTNVPLTLGNNTIVVRGTNVLGDIYESSVVITRYPEGTGTPVVNILSAPAWVYYDENKATVAGVNTNIVGKLSWVNDRHTEKTNTFNTGFSVQVNNLEHGDNWITVFGTNLFGDSDSDCVMIMRQTAVQRFALTNFVWLSSPAPTPPYDSWSTAATNIQQALTAASSSLTGTVVMVTNGTYLLQEWIAVTSAVYLTSVNGPDFTILNANSPVTTNRALLVRHSLAVVDGFTVSNAYWSPNGGGAFIATAGGTIINCTFINCTAGEKGGGIYLNRAGRVEACRFINCTAGNWGGGAHLEQGGQIYNSTVSGCYATVFGGGFSIYGGGRLYTCLVTHNAARRGGGVYTRYWPSRLDNCTIVSNSAEIQAGGLYIREGPDMRGSIVYYNIAPTNENWFRYGTIDVDSSCTWPGLGSNRVTNEPQFVNTGAGNYRLQVTSPCINKGPTYAWMNGAVDLDGNPRVSSGLVDLGVYEMDTEPHVTITNTPFLIAYPVSQSDLGGTNGYWVAGTMWWTNAATAAQASFGPFNGVTNWMIPAIDLVHGDNPITVFASNTWGYIGSDSIILHRETYLEGIPKIATNTLVFPFSGSMLDVVQTTNIVWNPLGITDAIDGTNLMIALISVHRSNNLAEVSVPATDIPNGYGWCPWQPPQELIAGMTTYVVRFDVVDSSSLTNSRVFYDHAFIVVPEPVGVWVVLLVAAMLRKLSHRS
jgi:hypothetical protein